MGTYGVIAVELKYVQRKIYTILHLNYILKIHFKKWTTYITVLQINQVSIYHYLPFSIGILKSQGIH